MYNFNTNYSNNNNNNSNNFLEAFAQQLELLKRRKQPNNMFGSPTGTFPRSQGNFRPYAPRTSGPGNTLGFPQLPAQANTARNPFLSFVNLPGQSPPVAGKRWTWQ